MPYFIRTTDKADSAALRAATRAAHLEYLTPFLPRILAGGGFLDDDGSLGGGGMILFDTELRSEAEALAAHDPYQLAGVFERVEIVRWRKVIFDGELLS